jgi:hypothetical protein
VASEALGWDAWLAARQYYGPRITFEALRDTHCRYAEPTIEGCLRAWTRADDSKRARDRYDPKRREWHYLLVDFTDNYCEYAAVLNVLQHLSAFKDTPEPGYALVFHHVFGQGAIDALVRIDRGHAAFLEPDTDEAREFARFAAASVERATGILGWLRR